VTSATASPPAAARKEDRPPRHRPAAAGLLLLSPVCAEYLIGYDASIGRPLHLLLGLLILGPLYGAVAVLIRETVRRAGRGWPTMLLLSAALGLAQAGLIDQSLFHLEFGEDDPDWATEQPVTPLPWLGVDAKNLLNWVGGHVIWSFAAPIAVVEACVPRAASRPWLGRTGLGVMTVLYLAAAALLISDVEGPGATGAEAAGAAVTVAVLAVTAFALPRRTGLLPRPGRVPGPWLLGAGAAAVFATDQMVGRSWTATAVDAAVLALLGTALLVWSARAGWTRRHVLAVAGAALLVRVGLSFLVEPLGNPSTAAKYGANATLTVCVVLLLAWASHRLRRVTDPASPPPAPASPGGSTAATPRG
jgi:hypothetical protein